MKVINKMKKVIKRKEIDPNVLIEELIETYPQVVDFLVNEYEFYCVNCMLAGLETFKEGAEAHGIIGKDFEKMLAQMNDLINNKVVPAKAD